MTRLVLSVHHRMKTLRMTPIAPVTVASRERIAQEFDDRGPEACMAEIMIDLRRNNPELLDIASRCAASLGNAPRIMQAFGIFYRLMIDPWLPVDDPLRLSPLPRVTPETRDRLVADIDRKGPEAFTLGIITDLERRDPELLQALHSIASAMPDPLGMAHGLALFYHAVVVQMPGGESRLH
jgi:hypothetical protein